jgi:hypothetical protein
MTQLVSHINTACVKSTHTISNKQMLGASPNHKTLYYGFAIQFNIHQFTSPHIYTRPTRIAATQHHTQSIPHKETTKIRIHKDILTATSQPSIHQLNRKICLPHVAPNTQHPTQPQLRASKDNVTSNVQTINNVQATSWSACTNINLREPSTPHQAHTLPQGVHCILCLRTTCVHDPS